MIVIDTDVLIEILDKKSGKGDEALKLILQSGEEIFTTVITLHEVLYGLRKCEKPAKDVLLLPVLSYTKRDALLSSRMELEAERQGKTIPRVDTMIAAMTVNNGAKLYTLDLKHFSSLKEFGLKLFP